MTVLAAYLAACVDHRGTLAPGERGVIPLLAASTQQAATAFAFVEGIFAVAPNLKDLVDGATSDTLSLTTAIDISVRPASYRTIRGITAVAAICDEIAFWRSDDSANPDKEILKALRPSLATTGGLLICISSPYAKRGELYATFKRHFGPTGHPLILVAKAPSRTMNPSLPQRVVDRAYEEDPEAASAEYGAEFRGDLEVFVSREIVDAVTFPDRLELPPIAGVTYLGAVDAAGGSGGDSMTAAIAHAENGVVVLDAIREAKSPFSPDAVVTEFCAFFRGYRISEISGDRWGSGFVSEQFERRGISYRQSEKPKSDIYKELLPLLNSRRIELLDIPRLSTQLIGLERRTARGGRDSIDHAPGGHDDVINAAAIALVQAAGIINADGFDADTFLKAFGGVNLHSFARPSWAP
jgi:hypothetical protein